MELLLHPLDLKKVENESSETNKLLKLEEVKLTDIREEKIRKEGISQN